MHDKYVKIYSFSITNSPSRYHQGNGRVTLVATKNGPIPTSSCTRSFQFYLVIFSRAAASKNSTK